MNTYIILFKDGKTMEIEAVDYKGRGDYLYFCSQRIEKESDLNRGIVIAKVLLSEFRGFVKSK